MQLIANNIEQTNKYAHLDREAKIELYEKLKRCKNYAINRSYRHYSNIPIERQDLESIAWMAFEEVLEKFKTYEGPKKFESFFMDNVYWRCNDYCQKFANNRHRVLNYANSKYFYQDWNYTNMLVDIDWNKTIALKQYYDNLKPGDKKMVYSMLYDSYSTSEIKKKIYSSKTKVYRTMNLLAKDLREIV